MKRIKRPQNRGRTFFRDARSYQDDLQDHFGHRRKLWFSFEPPDVPEWQCCYVLYVKGKLVYIGQTSNLKLRIRAHYAKGGLRGLEWADVRIKAKLGRRYGCWAMDEIRLIDRLQPSWNRSSVVKHEAVY